MSFFMNKKILFMIIAICLFVSINLNASEKVSTKEDSGKSYSLSFSKAFKDGPSFGLVEKMAKEGKEVDYAALSQNMFYLGVAGAVIAGVSLLLVIVGAVLYGVGYSIFWVFDVKYTLEEELNGLYMEYAGYALIGAFSFFLVVGIIMAAVGFALWKIFGKRAESASIFMEKRRGIVLTDTPYQTNPAIGIKFSF
jgi:hypothetical protein